LCVQCSDKNSTEKILQAIYAQKRQHGEWFKLSKYELKEIQHLMQVFAENPSWDRTKQYEYALKKQRKYKIDWQLIGLSISGSLLVFLVIFNFHQKNPQVKQLKESSISEKTTQQASLSMGRLYETEQRLACGVSNDPGPPTNIRSGPGKNFKEIGTISTNGTFVAIYERQKGWLRVVSQEDGHWGWVSEKLVSITPCS
jgi:hypothetical protein